MFCSLVQRGPLQDFHLRNSNKIVENEDICNSDKQWLHLLLLLITENKTPVNMPISHNSLHKKKKNPGTYEPLILRQVCDFLLQSTKGSTRHLRFVTFFVEYSLHIPIIDRSNWLCMVIIDSDKQLFQLSKFWPTAIPVLGYHHTRLLWTPPNYSRVLN